jgi:hypothetical protein
LKKPELLRAAKSLALQPSYLIYADCVSRPGASALAERASAVHTVVVARPAVHKQWLGEGVVIGRSAKTAAAEAFTDSLEHGGRDIQVDLNVSLAGRCSVAFEVSSRTAHCRAHHVRVGEAV